GLLRSQDPTVKLRAAEQLSKLDAQERGGRPANLPTTPDGVILECLKELDGKLFIPCGMLFETGSGEVGWQLASTGLLAPHCRTRYPDLGARKRAELAGHEDGFDELGAGELLSVEEIIARLERHVAAERVEEFAQ